ncbi:MAG: hypothetical protein O2887_13975 [Bacteroidetes bacterium]|nr:hypothetical protein [Bacteroidota bacterium]MDA1121577.1 hypothetical protein [Bacteroidota bacterium]
MESLTKLALKGHFADLRNQIIGKRNVESSGDQKDLEGEALHKLLELLIKAVAIVEDVHQTDATLIDTDQAEDYREMILALNTYGISYKGLPEIIEIKSLPAYKVPDKKPMQKAGKVSKDNQDQNRRTG